MEFYGLDYPKKAKKKWLAAKLAEYEGFDLGDLQRFEQQKQVAVWIYSLEDCKGRIYPHCRRQSVEETKNIMRLAVYGKHLMLIQDPRKFGESYPCTRCGSLFRSLKAPNRHFTHCRNCYSQDMYSYRNVKFYQWYYAHHRFADNMPLYPGFIAFDFESMLPLIGKTFGRGTVLPKLEEFHSFLRNGNELTPEIHSSLQHVWDTQGFKNCREFLSYYNAMDVDPFITAIQRMREHSHNTYQVDLVKNFHSLPSLALFQACFFRTRIIPTKAVSPDQRRLASYGI